MRRRGLDGCQLPSDDHWCLMRLPDARCDCASILPRPKSCGLSVARSCDALRNELDGSLEDPLAMLVIAGVKVIAFVLLILGLPLNRDETAAARA